MKSTTRIERAQKLILSGKLSKERAVKIANWLEWYIRCITDKIFYNGQKVPQNGNKCLTME